MKTKHFIGLASIVLLCSCQPSPRTTAVTGTLEGLGNDTLMVSYFPVSDLRRSHIQRDTLVAQQGHFTLTLPEDSVPTEVYFYIKPKAGHENSPQRSVSTVAFPGETVQLSGSWSDCQAAGNDFHQKLRDAEALYKPFQMKMDSIVNTLIALQNAGTLTEQSSDSLRKLYEPVHQQLRDAQQAYIRQHPDEDAALYLLSQQGSQGAKELLPLVGEKARSGAMASLYQAMKQALAEQEAREEARKNITEGKAAPDFTLKDIQGKDFTLSTLRGKHVVLDFWGSWCGWCIKGIPDMKKYYEKYKDRMEIVGIDCRDTEEKWKAAVEKHGLPWLHVRNSDDNDVTVTYGIQGYPTKIVIDPEGTIVKIVVGEDPAFYTYLDKLFNK